ncbi:MAG: hypothetical protein EB101_04760 [Chitinophagia bacterium]|nr:hypothetical protein [Chitinophagia bacterium]
MNPGALENAAARGTFIHNAVENWIRGLRVEPPKEYLPYWQDMPKKLEELLSGSKVLWSEKPYNQPQWAQYTGEDGVGRIHYYDAITGYGYAGCCDIIYTDANNEIILGDFKTSVGPYSYKFPKASANLDEKLRKALISGVFKLKKTQLQLAAYKLAAEKCLGIQIDKTQIIVSTPTPEFSVQVFTFGKNDIEKHEEQWMEVVSKFYSMQASP